MIQSILVTDPGRVAQSRLFWLVTPVCYSMLLGLTGYFLAQSRSASRKRDFGWQRMRRTMPIYGFTILVTVFGIGLLVTRLPIGTYLTEPDVGLYMLNLIGLPRLSLADVFEFNALPGSVNPNVLLAPAYLAGIGLLLALPATESRRLRIVITAGIATSILSLGVVSGFWLNGTGLIATTPSIEAIIGGDGLNALAGGLAGILVYRLRAELPANVPVAAGVLAVLLSLGWFAGPALQGFIPFRILLALTAAFAAIVFAQAQLPFGGLAQAVQPYLLGWLMLSFPLQQWSAQQSGIGQTVPGNLLWGAGSALLLAGVFHHVVTGRKMWSQPGLSINALSRTIARQLSRLRTAARRNFAQSALILISGGLLITALLIVITLVYIATVSDD